ncbi:hypothetical protein [Microbacterium oxydans]|uniref:DUF5134 domain-containing protein n=1 Tax=Microbacterium oxydans TaxID=82380 RepID=A0A0F0L8C4_9MICO|nr:hypothetical protein [Microbacterium oxydans]KJL29383.1 hypothetical protein RS83_02013 [Microbacterium oxydans]
MTDVLHLGTLLLAAVGVCALAGSPSRSAAPELLAALLMLFGMADTMTLSLLPPVVWFALMLVAALALAAVRRASTTSSAPSGPAPLSAHLALGLVATGVLVLLMPTMGPTPLVAAGSHAHAAAAALPQLLSAAVCAGTVVLAVIALRARPSWSHRLHHIAMAASTVAMGAIVAT